MIEAPMYLKGPAIPSALEVQIKPASEPFLFFCMLYFKYWCYFSQVIIDSWVLIGHDQFLSPSGSAALAL